MAGLSVLIPVFNYPVGGLVAQVLAQTAAWPGPVEVLLLDDGSRDEIKIQNRVLAVLPGVQYTELPANVGRAAIRNQLAERAAHEWLLLLDNDSQLLDDQFVARYAAAVAGGGAVLIGGTAYAATPPSDPALRLRWQYGRAREQRPAAARQRDPGGQLAINNALINRKLLKNFPFDERVQGYGHEDTRLGLALARAGVPIQHLDNPVLHLGLEPAAAFLEKSRQAVQNLAQGLRAEGLGVDTRLAHAATLLRRVGLAGATAALLAALEPALRRNLLSERPSLRALDALKLRWLLQEWA